MRYVRVTRLSFQDLERIIGKFPIYAIEVDHLRGIMKIIHHSDDEVRVGATPVEDQYQPEADEEVDQEESKWVYWSMPVVPKGNEPPKTFEFWLYLVDFPDEIEDSTAYFQRQLVPAMQRARATAPFGDAQLTFCKMGTNGHPAGIHIQGIHP